MGGGQNKFLAESSSLAVTKSIDS